ncbi:MAG: MFS transporter [Actinophytocola sp.]|nr:MFS transporter [Actinophytocola sp.]
MASAEPQKLAHRRQDRVGRHGRPVPRRTSLPATSRRQWLAHQPTLEPHHLPELDAHPVDALRGAPRQEQRDPPGVDAFGVDRPIQTAQTGQERAALRVQLVGAVDHDPRDGAVARRDSPLGAVSLAHAAGTVVPRASHPADTSPGRGVSATCPTCLAPIQNPEITAEPLWFGADAWRWMFFAELVPAVAYGVLVLRIPESPRYLITRQRVQEARKVLSDFVGGDVDGRIAEIKRTLNSQRAPRVSDLAGPRFGLLPIVWVGIGLSLFQQSVGINVIFYYSTELWQHVGFTESDSFLISAITAVTNVVVTFIAIATVDRVGRKPLLLIGSIGMFVSLSLMAVLFGSAPVVNGDPALGAVAGPIALVAANAFVVFFGMSWGPVVWVLLGEMFNNRIRASAIAVAAAAQWLANFAVSTTFPALSELGLGFAYGLYAVCAGLSIVFVAKAIRETKGMELEQMP